MKATVLLAEADRALSAVCGRFLTRWGYFVEVVASGLECISRLGARRPDLLILDVEMPWGGDGVLAYLAEENPPIPPVILTGTAASAPLRATWSRRLGMPSLDKPFAVAALLDCLLRAERESDR
jgi:CheY-like chemotaxis protein